MEIGIPIILLVIFTESQKHPRFRVLGVGSGRVLRSGHRLGAATRDVVQPRELRPAFCPIGSQLESTVIIRNSLFELPGVSGDYSLSRGLVEALCGVCLGQVTVS